jgi:hypothetical protein
MASALERFRAKRRGERVVVAVDRESLEKLLSKMGESPETYGPPSMSLTKAAEAALGENENHVGP